MVVHMDASTAARSTPPGLVVSGRLRFRRLHLRLFTAWPLRGRRRNGPIEFRACDAARLMLKLALMGRRPGLRSIAPSGLRK
jgi:hypothetical protein